MPRSNTPPYRSTHQALELTRIGLHLFANDHAVAIADRGQSAHDALNGLFDRGARKAGVGKAGGDRGQGMGGKCVE